VAWVIDQELATLLEVVENVLELPDFCKNRMA
jgi:hypothetical protein